MLFVRLRFMKYSLVPLLIGGLTYIGLRTESLRMFKWIKMISLESEVGHFRNIMSNFSPYFPQWVKFSLPDGLWMFSYTSVILIIWEGQINRASIIWLGLIPIVAITSEIFQLLGLLTGTFDWFDFVFYLLGFCIPIYYLPLKIKNYAKL